MCGIFGFVSNEIYNPGEFWRFADRLFYHTERRGHQASGFAATADGAFVTDKRALSAEYFTKISKPWRNLRYSKKVALIGHTRAATSGSPDKNENNHPFHGPRYSVAHNGGVGAHRRVAEALGYRLRTECDSELLLHLVEDGKTIDDGVIRAYNEVDRLSWMAVCILERKKGLVHLFRDNQSPCSIISLPRWNVTIFCSTKYIVADALEDVIGNRNTALQQAIPIFKDDMPPYTRITINEDGELSERYLYEAITGPSYSMDRIQVYAGGGRYSDDDWNAWHDVSTYSGGPSRYPLTTTTPTTTSGGASTATTKSGRDYEDTASFDKCDECGNLTDELDLEEGVCPDCLQQAERQESSEGIRQLIENERQASSGLLNEDEVTVGEEEESSFTPEEERRILTSYNSCCRIRDPNPQFTEREMQDYLSCSDLSWSARKTLWSDMTIAKAKRMNNGEWKAYLNFVRDLQDEDAKRFTSPSVSTSVSLEVREQAKSEAIKQQLLKETKVDGGEF